MIPLNDMVIGITTKTELESKRALERPTDYTRTPKSKGPNPETDGKDTVEDGIRGYLALRIHCLPGTFAPIIRTQPPTNQLLINGRQAHCTT